MYNVSNMMLMGMKICSKLREVLRAGNKTICVPHRQNRSTEVSEKLLQLQGATATVSKFRLQNRTLATGKSRL
jgi:hypothetical protein